MALGKERDGWAQKGKKVLKKFLLAPQVSKTVTAVVRGNAFIGETIRRRAENSIPIRTPIISTVLPNGQTLFLYHQELNEISRAIFWRGFSGYENGCPAFFYDLCKRADLVIDVGANIGYYSLLAGMGRSNVRVFALEPHPKLFQQLIENISLNSLDRMIVPVEIAASDHSGEAILYIPEMGSNLESSIMIGFRRDVRALGCRCITLDGFVNENGIPKVDIVKIDVEGAEHLVLQGMTRILKEMKPDIVCEVLPGRFQAAAEELLKKYGYKFAWIKGKKLVKTDCIDPNLVANSNYRYLNYFFSARIS